QPTTWMAADGKARYRWDAIRKVTGQKVVARDYRARDLPGWPKQQAHAVIIKATRIDKVFEWVDLSRLGDELQPDRLLYHEDLENDGVQVSEAADLGADFYGNYFLVPRGTTSPMYGHPVALLVYHDFDRFEMAKRLLRIADDVVVYGDDGPSSLPDNYGAARYVRVGGSTPTAEDEFSAVQNTVI